MATSTISINAKQALGAAMVEVLVGNLTDETIEAMRGVRKEEVPASLVDFLHAIQGMSMHPIVRESASLNALGELSAAMEDSFQQRLNS